MRRGRILIFLLLILIVGLAVAYVAIRAFLSQPARPATPTTVKVFAAGQNITQGATITENALMTVDIPSSAVTAVEFTEDEKAQLVGKVALYPLQQGAIITSAMVTEASNVAPAPGPQWATQIPSGMTAVSIPATRLALTSYGINDGARINVIACFLFVDVDAGFQSITPDLTATLTATGFPKDTLPVLTLGVGGAGGPQGRLELDPSLQQPFYYIPSEPQRPRVVCQTILQNVTVMKLGDFSLTGTAAAAAQQQPQQAAPTAPDVITLMVSPQDAVTLSYMVYTNAQIMMTLRNPSDQSRLATEAATLQFLLSQYNIPVPAKLPYALQPRIDALSAPALPNDAGKPAP